MALGPSTRTPLDYTPKQPWVSGQWVSFSQRRRPTISFEHSGIEQISKHITKFLVGGRGSNKHEQERVVHGPGDTGCNWRSGCESWTLHAYIRKQSQKGPVEYVHVRVPAHTSTS